MDGALFEFERVAVVKDDVHLLRDATCTIPDHRVTVIVGPSGSGKSTLLRLCNRLEKPTSGTIRYAGGDLSAVDPLSLRRQVGMVFQRPIALPGTVADNLRVGEPDATDVVIEDTLERVGLPGMSDRDASALSGGEAQRMCLARTLVAGPRFVLFDEPTSSLDPHAVSGIEALALELADQGTPSAWVTHDLAQMRRLAHHLIVVIEGTVVQQGDLAAVLAAPEPSVTRFLAGEAQ